MLRCSFKNNRSTISTVVAVAKFAAQRQGEGQVYQICREPGDEATSSDDDEPPQTHSGSSKAKF
jgi:hypothetical protein